MTIGDLARVRSADAEFAELMVDGWSVSHGSSSHNANPNAREKVRNLHNDRRKVAAQYADMAKGKKIARPKNHLRAWRVFRKMTLEALAEAVGTSKGQVSDLENGERGLTDKWAHRLARALRTKPGFLFDHDPEDLDTDILEIWADIPLEDKPRLTLFLETYRRKKT